MFLRHISQSTASGGSLLTVVPTNRLIRHLRTASILSSGTRAVTPPLFHTLETAARSIHQEMSRPRQIATGPARSFLFYEAVRSTGESPGIQLSRGSCAKMLGAITTYEESGITADRLAQELASLEPHEKLRIESFLRYYRNFEKELHKARVVDAPALFQHFRDGLAQTEFEEAVHKAFPDVREILIEGFDDFAEPESAFIERLTSIPSVNVSIRLGVVPGNPALSGHIDKQESRFRAIGFGPVGAEEPADPLALRLFKSRIAAAPLDLTSRVTMVEARTRWHEVTAICRLIKRIAADKPGRDLSAICVALPRPETYTEIIRERFAAYGIPSNITDRFELSRSPLVTDIVGLLEMRRRNFERDDALRVLQSPLLSSEDGIDRGNLIDISRRLRVTGGFELWLRKIDAEIRLGESRLRAVAESAGVVEGTAYLRALRKAREDIGKLEELTHDFEGNLTPGEFENFVDALLHRLNLPDRLASPGAARELQERDARAYTRFLDILRETVRFLEDRTGPARHGLSYYLDLLESAISGERYNVRERDGGVLVTDLEETRGMPVEVMILAGMEDGCIPGPSEPEIFLSSAFQQAREQKRLQRSRYLFYRAATNWTEQLYITYPLRDGGVDLVRSSFLDALLAAASVQIVNDRSLSIASDALFSEEEFLEWYSGREDNGEKSGSEIPKRLRERARQVRQGGKIERSRSKTHELEEFEGVIGGALSSRASTALRKLGAAAFSVSDLETFGECPFKFFAGSLLGLRSPAEFLEEVSSVERGYIVHDVLFEFYREWHARGLPPVWQLTDKDFEDAVRQLEGIAERRLGRMDIPGPLWELEKDYFLGRSGPESGLFRAFLLAERGRTDRMRPGFFEVAFGQSGNRPGDVDPRLSTPATVRIGDVNLRGRIDRVDLGDDCFTVIDYKTGSAVPTLADIRSGASLQLPLYMRAAEALLGYGAVQLAPAAGMYYRLREPVELQLAVGSARYSGMAFEAPRASRRVLKTQDELVAIVNAAVQRANAYVAAMQRGLFPLAPPEHRETACRYCEFATICRVRTVQQEREETSGMQL